MDLQTIIGSQEELDRLFSSFEEFSSLGLGIGGYFPTPLPKDMRLTPYFLVNLSTPKHFDSLQATVEVYCDRVLSPEQVVENSGIVNLVSSSKNQVTLRSDDLTLCHRITSIMGKPMYRQALSYMISEESQTSELFAVSLFSGNGYFNAGQDFNAINHVGAVVLGGEDEFDGFLSGHRLKFDRKKYAARANKHELTITPKFVATGPDFRTTTNEIIGITNQVLQIMHKHYGRSEYQLKVA